MPMMILSNVSGGNARKLQVLLAGAVSATECPLTVGYRRRRMDSVGGGENTFIDESATGITTGGTAVDLLAAPPVSARYDITEFSLFNADNAAVTATVRQHVTAADTTTTTRVVVTVAVPVGASLLFSESRGWYVMTTNGAQQVTASTDASSAMSAATSAGLADSQSRSSATSAGLATSVGTSAATSAGLADSVSRSEALSAGASASVARSSITSGTV